MFEMQFEPENDVSRAICVYKTVECGETKLIKGTRRRRSLRFAKAYSLMIPYSRGNREGSKEESGKDRKRKAERIERGKRKGSKEERGKDRKSKEGRIKRKP